MSPASRLPKGSFPPRPPRASAQGGDAAADARGALPSWSLPVSLLGLAILLVSTLPALVARRSLEIAERQTVEEIKTTQETTERLRRDRRAVLTDRFVLDRAVRELLEPGPTVALPRVPVTQRR